MAAYHLAPAGYTRTCTTMEAHGCAHHDAYRIGCPACGYDAVEHSVTLGGDIVAMIIDDDGDVLDWLTLTEWPDMAANLAHDGTAVICDTAQHSRPARALAHECELVADCFALTLPPLPESLATIPATR